MILYVSYKMFTGGFCISQVRKQSPWGLGVRGVVFSVLEYAGTELELPSPWGFKWNPPSGRGTGDYGACLSQASPVSLRAALALV